MRTGSMINSLMSDSASAVPTVGMGATLCGWTDRHPYTVVGVISPKRLVLQADKAVRTDANGMSECQGYEFQADPNGALVTVTLRKTGRWHAVGSTTKSSAYVIGHRSAYHDYSF